MVKMFRKQITFPEEWRAELERKSKKEGNNISTLIRTAIRRFLNSNGNGK